MGKEIKWTKDTREAGISGKVYVQFVIKEDGYVDKSQIKVLFKDDLMSVKLIADVTKVIDDDGYTDPVINAVVNMAK